MAMSIRRRLAEDDPVKYTLLLAQALMSVGITLDIPSL